MRRWRRHGLRSSASPAEWPARRDVGRALELLEDLLDGSSLANGVIELVVEDATPQQRRLLDVHDGQIVPLQPGSAVPWASVSGTREAWERALGSDGDVSGLQHTGESQLAERLLAELQRLRLDICDATDACSVLDCS